MEEERFLSIFQNRREGRSQKVMKSTANRSVIFKPEIQVRGVFQLEKYMESRCQIEF